MIGITYIEWCDAIGQETWNSKDELIEWAKGDNWIVKEAGFIIDETDEYILLSNRRRDDTPTPNFAGTTKIPKTWIRKRKEI